MSTTITRQHEAEIASVQPAGRIPMTLPVHTDQPVSIHVPTLLLRPNPVNCLAWPGDAAGSTL